MSSVQMILIKTELWDIKVEINLEKAPITSTNFLRYVDNRLYDGTTFFRAVSKEESFPNQNVPIEVIQGGQVSKEKEYPPIEHETTEKTGLKHVEGAISMSRGKPGSATSSFFFCLRDEPELDYGGHRNADGQGFSAFGKIVSGIEVAKKVHEQPREGQRLKQPIGIISISRI